MDQFLLHYVPVSPTTWAYLSSLLTIALYFKFSRLWSVRNLDLLGLILFTPGLLFVLYGQEKGLAHWEQTGYAWLFVTGGLFIVRMLVDPMMVRRPLLEPNLSVGGLTFLGVALFVFLMANVVGRQQSPRQTASEVTGIAAESAAPNTSNNGIGNAADGASGATPVADDSPAAPQPDDAAADSAVNDAPLEPLERYGPGYPWILDLFQFPGRVRLLFAGNGAGDTPAVAAKGTVESEQALRLTAARTIAILSHLAVVMGMIVIGYRHFDNVKTGIAAAVLYLLLPYNAYLTDRTYHVLLAAMLVWAVVMYRRPLIAGTLLGLAIGSFYFPVFLLPLWCSFYWQRGVTRFAGGALTVVAGMVLLLYLFPHTTFAADVRQMTGWILPRTTNLEGFWGLEEYNDPVYRIPVLVAFIALCITLAIWPAQKNLGTLLSCSAAVMLGTQFWHAMYGGQLMGWYLPLLLLTIFRPNLEDRVALSVLGTWNFSRRKLRIVPIDRAA